MGRGWITDYQVPARIHGNRLMGPGVLHQLAPRLSTGKVSCRPCRSTRCRGKTQDTNDRPTRALHSPSVHTIIDIPPERQGHAARDMSFLLQIVTVHIKGLFTSYFSFFFFAFVQTRKGITSTVSSLHHTPLHRPFPFISLLLPSPSPPHLYIMLRTM